MPTSSLAIPSVYPRVCGGTDNFIAAGANEQGLSPRVRGNHFGGCGILRLRWSIPACAGEPPEVVQEYRGSKVYPRVCGGTQRCS